MPLSREKFGKLQKTRIGPEGRNYDALEAMVALDQRASRSLLAQQNVHVAAGCADGILGA
jgi:hypothetical protein